MGSHSPGLTLVATPIGNLGDLSDRAAAVLGQADLILCEDTRVTSRLLSSRGIATPTRALHDHNEQNQVSFLVDKLQSGARLALVSDAGTPLMSDPGYRLVLACIEARVPVSAVPGPNAAIMALTLSGLPPHPFLFVGFPPPRAQARQTAFARLRAAEQAGLHATLIWHEAPHRLCETLEDLALVFGPDRPTAVARELTKRFEEVVRGTVSEVSAHFAETAPRGEITLLVGPPPADDNGAASLDEHLRQALRDHSVKDAATLVAGIVQLPRRTVYARALELAREAE
ncbi:16S rRNA (cytidine(1402)-2'-O)-methyltransferase [Tanticharoenia sakaeratensis]|uniref:Ribosomal RNA small subunit methyltransferase I n=1 Tax=Tanticharoenia sakaeratensis NBRC 103193 TaxID=1231623 RepID=A0A0D6MJ18_9PROT|nr:16S rRNA (cytidine(1402)-2'-O)-methyltransferase [Tanticharoenia sakaeratensis]GAN53248.1 corrin/porphyrin methyltransferase [Tanticharoenia sakaeratensis NBRC 103193]GBQ21191.1 tetrapyrrole/corrin/porphyrin methyltransferase [Tanticharoenia sakaeratensis NBRC 103193]